MGHRRYSTGRGDADKRKTPLVPSWDERRAFRGTTQIRTDRPHALESPDNGGHPTVSPQRLPGEPNQASTVWLAAGDQTSLGGVSRLFSRSLLISNIIHSTNGREMQGGIFPPGKTILGNEGCRRRGFSGMMIKIFDGNRQLPPGWWSKLENLLALVLCYIFVINPRYMNRQLVRGKNQKKT